MPHSPAWIILIAEVKFILMASFPTNFWLIHKTSLGIQGLSYYIDIRTELIFLLFSGTGKWPEYENGLNINMPYIAIILSSLTNKTRIKEEIFWPTTDGYNSKHTQKYIHTQSDEIFLPSIMINHGIITFRQ